MRYNSDWEKSVFKNLCALNPINGTMLDSLSAIQQKEEVSLNYCTNARPSQIPHRLIDSQYVKLKYAVGISTSCGFTDPFSRARIEAKALKDSVDLMWNMIQNEMHSICTNIERKMPINNKWSFKSKLEFLNTVLKRILGLKIGTANSRRTEYIIKHTSNVGKYMLAPQDLLESEVH